MAATRDVEKQAANKGSQPQRLTSMQVAAQVQDPSQYSLKRRPWRPRTTPFEHLLHQEYRGDGSVEHPFIITWLDDDPENPQTYSTFYKWYITAVVAIVTLCVALASSAYSGAVDSIEKEFAPSTEVAILGVSLFVLGFALGPLIWAPVSEVWGRRITLVGTYIMFTLWNGVAAASPNMAALIVFRFLAGAFGSSPLTNSGGTISDMFNAKQRGLATALFAAAPFLGPALGPITGGFIGLTSGWRWVQGFLALFSGACAIVSFLTIPETYAPTLLRARAGRLSKVTGKYYRAPMDAKKELVVKDVFKVSLTRPWTLLIEPIVLLLTIYTACVYGTLYMLFAAFPIVFQQGRGWNSGVGGLAFLGVLVGMLIGVLYVVVWENPHYIKIVDKHNGRAPPEARLQAAMVGAPLLVIGLAWFAATDSPSVHWIVPILAGVPFATGMILVFLGVINYLIDCYTVFAASTLAANSVLRSLFGAAFPLFTTPMLNNIGIHWGIAVPGFIALICLPFPYLFYKYGESIRMRCKFAREADKIMKEMSAGGGEEKPKQADPSEPQLTAEEQEEEREMQDAETRSQHEHQTRETRGFTRSSRSSSERTVAESGLQASKVTNPK